jgi:hypothetical protein
MTKSTPDPPDYRAAAEETAASSRGVTEQQTWANRPNINTPFGQQTWEVTPQWDPSTGQYLNTWTQNTNLTPESQAALDSQMRITQDKSNLAESMIGRAQNEYGQEMDWDQFTDMANAPEASQYGELPDVPGYERENIQRSIGDSGRYRDEATAALNEQFDKRMEPRLQRQMESRRTQLYNQGLKEGDEAFDNAMGDLGQEQEDARRQADLDAILTGGQEAQRYQGMDVASGSFANQAAQQALQQQLGIGSQEFQQGTTRAGMEDTRAQTGFGQELQRSNYQNTQRQQQIAEEMQRRGLTINEMNAILTGQQVNMPNMPGFNQAAASAATNYTGAARDQYGAEMDAFNAQQQQMQGIMQGAAGGAMMFSDRRLKKNVKCYGRHPGHGLNLYRFNYLWEKDDAPTHIGVMSDEVGHIPGAVIRHESGFEMVNYRVINDYTYVPVTPIPGYDVLEVRPTWPNF